jgi:hypothetical protein
MSRHLGQETVRILVSQGVTNKSSAPHARSFTVHKQLLALFSGHFRTLFGDFIDRKILHEVVNEIVVSEGTSQLECGEELPTGYILSSAALAEEFRKAAADETGHGDVEAAHAEEVYELLDEQARIFNIFVHWLYTQQLLPFKAKDSFENTLAEIYALAERLDVPLLRQQCYEKIRQRYQDKKHLPIAAAMQVVVEQTPETSMLRKYFVGLFAHAVLNKFEKEAVNEVLDSYPDFAREVSAEILERLRDDVSMDPREDLYYAIDDSDSDYATSWEEDSELERDGEYDSAGYMSLSEAEENDSLADAEDLSQIPPLPADEKAVQHLLTKDKSVEPGDSAQDSKESSPSESRSATEGESEPEDEDEDPENVKSHDKSTLQAATESNIRSRTASVTREALQELTHLAMNSKPKAAIAPVASHGGTKRKHETSPFDNLCADGGADSVRHKTQVVDLTGT